MDRPSEVNPVRNYSYLSEEKVLSQLQFVSELQLDQVHEGQALLVRTGVPQAVTCYRALVVLVAAEETLVIFRNTSRRENSAPQLAFFLGSTNGGGEFRPNYIRTGMSLGFETEREQLITSRVMSDGICFLPSVAVVEKDQMILTAVRQLALDSQASEYGVLPGELDGCTPFERVQIISTLSGLPGEYRRSAATAILAAYNSGNRRSFFGTLSSHATRARLLRMAEGGKA